MMEKIEATHEAMNKVVPDLISIGESLDGAGPILFDDPDEIVKKINEAVEQAIKAEAAAEISISEALVHVYNIIRLALKSAEHQDLVNAHVKESLSGENGIAKFDVRKNTDKPFSKPIRAFVTKRLNKPDNITDARTSQYSSALSYCLKEEMSVEAVRAGFEKHGVHHFCQKWREQKSNTRDDPAGNADDAAANTSTDNTSGENTDRTNSALMGKADGNVTGSEQYPEDNGDEELLQAVIIAGLSSQSLSPGECLFLGRVDPCDDGGNHVTIFEQVDDKSLTDATTCSSETASCTTEKKRSVDPISILTKSRKLLGVCKKASDIQIVCRDGETFFGLRPKAKDDVHLYFRMPEFLPGATEGDRFAICGDDFEELLDFINASNQNQEFSIQRGEDGRLAITCLKSNSIQIPLQSGDSVYIDDAFGESSIDDEKWNNIDECYSSTVSSRSFMSPELSDVYLKSKPGGGKIAGELGGQVIRYLPKVERDFSGCNMTMYQSKKLQRVDLEIDEATLSVVRFA